MGSPRAAGRVVVSIEVDALGTSRGADSLVERLRSKGIAVSAVLPVAAYLEAGRAYPHGCEKIMQLGDAAVESAGRMLSSVEGAKAVAVTGQLSESLVRQLARAGVEVVLSDRAAGPGRWRAGIWTRSGQGLIRPLGYGVWELGTSQRLPHQGSRRDQRRGWHRAIDALGQAADEGGLCHLSIRPSDMSAGAQKPLMSLIAEVQRLCGESRLQATRICNLAGEMVATGHRRGAGSVLRRAA